MVKFIIDLTDENTLLTVLIFILFANNQSRNLAPSDDEYDFNDLLPKTLVTYLTFLLAGLFQQLILLSLMNHI